MELPSNSLWNAFIEGYQFHTCDGECVTTRIVDAGTLILPTGRIVVTDPFLDPFSKPFTVRVPPGAYPVMLSLIKEDVALVLVSFSEGNPVLWLETKPDCFSVDSAHGCLMDHKIARFLRKQAKHNKYDKYYHRFEDALAENSGISGNYCFDSVSGANIILFHTWGGDGTYPSFFGYNAENKLVCLVTDMFLGIEQVLDVHDA
ncbi:MAG: DUF4241 domain-containing protein [Zavarzinella sp.]